MTVAVERVAREKIALLISTMESIKITDEDKRVFGQCLMQTTSLWMGLVDGKFACTWGLIPPSLLSDHAYLWLYTTEEVKAHEFLFIRHSQRALEEILKEYPVITGYTNVAWTQTIRWLKWLGAEFGDHNGDKLPFVIRKK